MRPFTVATLVAFAQVASAFIGRLEQNAEINGTYRATEATSTFPLDFVTGSSKVSFFDLTASIGITTPEKYAANNATLGRPLVNIDFVALNRSDSGPGRWTYNVPISPEDLFEGSGQYILVASITRVTGTPSNDFYWRADGFALAFNATVASS